MAQIINLPASKSFNTSAIKNKYIGTLIVNSGTLASPCQATVKLRFLAGREAGAFFSRPVRRGIPAILPAFISTTFTFNF
jgi:hypothetical protein